MLVARAVLTAAAVGAAVSACGERGTRHPFSGMPTLVASESIAATEGHLRHWLAYVHMESDHAECFIGQIKASEYWRAEPPADVPPHAADEFAVACGVDYSEMYTVSRSD